MSQRKTIRLLCALLVVLAAASAALGGLAFGGYEQAGEWQKRAKNLENALAAAQTSLSAQQARYQEKSAEADALRASAELSAQLQSEIALSQQELSSALSENERQKSLAAAYEERSGALSVENADLQEMIVRLQEQAVLDRAEIDRLGALLTEREESLAGVQALYKEATSALISLQARADESAGEIDICQTCGGAEHH